MIDMFDTMGTCVGCCSAAGLMTEDGVWHLAPAYDLTGEHFSDGDDAWGQWQNQHALSVNGKFSNIIDEDLLLVGERWSVGSAPRVLQEVQKVFK
jgi:serine/threonine-protein kinase HipA